MNSNIAQAKTRQLKRTLRFQAVSPLESLEQRQLLSATTFAAPVPYNIGSAPSSALNNVSADGVAKGEFNGDGKTDLAVVHSVDGTVNILLNKGVGTFSPAVSYPTGVSNPIWVTVADFNGDKAKDLAVLGNNAIAVLIGNGNGTFKPAVDYTTGPVARGGIAVGDFNGDTATDMAVVQFGAVDSTHSGVDIFLNKGDGTFNPYTIVKVPPAARSVIAGDFNHDSKTDLAVADGLGVNNVLDPTYPAGITILDGNGKGTFTTAGQYNAVTTPDAGDDGKGGGDTVNPEVITALDVNGDGKTDLTLSLYDHNIDVFINQGTGTFAPGVGYTTGEYPRAVAMADVTGDGKADLVVANVGAHSGDKNQTEDGSIAILPGNGNGTFGSAIQLTPFAFPGWLTIGYFNSDSLPDLAVTRVQDGHSLDIFNGELISSLSKPTVTAITPKSGTTAGGNAVTITGTNFTANMTVKFGSVAATSFEFNSATSITATTPAESAGTVDITVATPAGTSATSSADRFAFATSTTLPAPVIVSPGNATSPGPLITTTKPTFTWKPVTITNFTGYQLNLYDATAAKLVSYQFGTSVTSYTPTTALIAGHDYAWNVRLLNGTQSGPPSTNFYFRVPASTTTLPAPTIVGPGSSTSPGPVLTTNKPTLSWKAITGVTFTGYQIELYNVTQGTGTSYKVGVSVTSFTPSTPLVAGDKYLWNVRALNGTQSGPPSTYLYFEIPTLPAPVILGPGSSTSPGPVLTTTTPTFTWKAVTGFTFDSYQLNLYDITSGKSLSIQVTPTATSYTPPAGTLVVGDSYVWNLRLRVGTTTGPESSPYLFFQVGA